MLYFKYVKMHLRSFFQYRASAWMTLAGQFFIAFFAYLGIYFLFDRFGTIDGWTFGEVSLCFAVVQTAFAISECAARGFDHFSRLVVSGDFDRILLRPRSTVLQVFGSEFELSRIGKLLQSLLVLGIAVSLLETRLTLMKLATLVLMVVSGVFLFSGIFILGATLCFFTVQGLEVVNVFTDGGREVSQYPLTIYNKWVMRFFTFVIPFGAINFLPLLYLTDRAGDHPFFYMLSPLAGILFIIPCLFAWRAGVRRYRSTGN